MRSHTQEVEWCVLRGQKVLTVRVTESLQAKLRAAAAEKGVSLSTLIRSKLEREDGGRLEQRLDAIELQLQDINRLLQAGVSVKSAQELAPADSMDWMHAIVNSLLANNDEGKGGAGV